ncbi:MAG: tRNA (adenosine(37)-N6)-dimethylallyltransferase MiaA, partial [Gemmatimonadetes bacterium]|nr:tRNA (adenosine(37)-N6)-dimethylallyltransferase MiaA [Gemmatimonadota bacterium]
PTSAERARVPHHGLDVVDPGQRYSAGRFARDARRWIRGVRERGRVPLLVGGTGFFLRALTDPLFDEPPMDPARRRALGAWLEARSRDTLERWARRLDPERASVAAEGGPQRLVRTLEVALLTGRPLSWWHREAAAEGEPVPVLTVLLEVPRDELDRRIDARAARMFDEGLVEEVRALLASGVRSDAPGMSGVGYREVAAALAGETTMDEALEAIRSATRRYARRQLTWFRNQLGEPVIRLDGLLPLEEQRDGVVTAWRSATDTHTGRGDEG